MNKRNTGHEEIYRKKNRQEVKCEKLLNSHYFNLFILVKF